MSKAPTIYVESVADCYGHMNALEVNAVRRNIQVNNDAISWYDVGRDNFHPDKYPFMCYPDFLDKSRHIPELEDWYAGWYDAATEYELAITGEC